MTKNTKIEWTDHTFNPWIGCTKVGAGCDHCYAEAMMAKRLGKAQWGAGKERVRTSATNWNQPKIWNAHAESFQHEHGRRQRVFCASLADVFDNEVPHKWRQDLFDLILATPHLDWLLLTKRIGNAGKMLNDVAVCRHELLTANDQYRAPKNVWIGATIVNQAEADRDIPKLLSIPAAMRFLSMEPLLGHVDFSNVTRRSDAAQQLGKKALNGIDWVIVGGESGHGARPMHPDWVRSLRDQCTFAGVPFLFKQWGEHDLSYDRDRDDPDYRRCGEMDRLPGRWINYKGGHGFNGDRVHYAHRIGKKASGRELDGREWNEVPA